MKSQSTESGAGERRWNKTQLQVVSGFALIAVLAGLIAVFYPMFMPQGSGRLRSGMDLSNMKQVNLGLIMYSSDWDDLYPRTSKWMDDIFPYLRNEQLFHSLAESPNHSPTPSDPYGIAFRKSLEMVDSAKISTPEQVAVIFDSSDLSRNASGELSLLPNPPRHMSTTGNFNYIGFVDGHVKGMPRPLVGVK